MACGWCSCMDYWRVILIIIVAVLVAGFFYLRYMTRNRMNTSLQESTGKIIFSFVGSPGSGKGTLAQQAVRDLDFIALSTGDLCREHIAKGTEQGKLLQEYTKRGALVPDAVIVTMVKGWLDEHVHLGKSIILDGFPRTVTQADELQKLLKKSFPDHHFRVVLLDISDDEVVRRISNRLVCSNKQCQKVYTASHFVGKDHVCTQCGSSLIRRDDDREEVVRDRLAVYAKASAPVINHYLKTGVTMDTISVEGKSMNEVFAEFKKIIGRP